MKEKELKNGEKEELLLKYMKMKRKILILKRILIIWGIYIIAKEIEVVQGIKTIKDKNGCNYQMIIKMNMQIVIKKVSLIIKENSKALI